MTERFQGYLYLALAMIMVGSTVIASKLIAAGLPPFIATALRFAVAFPLFLALMRLTRTAWPRLERRAWLILILQAGAGSVGYTTLLIAGLRYSSATDAGVVIGTLPVVSAGIAILLLGERPSRSTLIAIGLAAAGVLTIVLRPDDGAEHSTLGITLVFAAVFCEGLFILINKRIRTPIAPLALSTIMAGMGVGVAFVPALFEASSMQDVTVQSLAAVLYYALVPTVAGFILWYAGSAKVSGTEASVFTALAPVSAVLFAFVLLGEPVSVNQLAGIGCVLVAVLSLAVPHLRLKAAGQTRS